MKIFPSTRTGAAQPSGSKNRATSESTDLLVQPVKFVVEATRRAKLSLAGLQRTPKVLTQSGSRKSLSADLPSGHS
ncbi:unnamed protein product [Lasius platythorax]|uniref:Uncharacterized protein n=1 Tax=Lasius platythorax TaxID=488582 RepID=A0AAV2NM75_9HYME